MTPLQRRLAKLEANRGVEDDGPAVRIVVRGGETVADVVARDFAGVEPPNLIARMIVTPGPAT